MYVFGFIVAATLGCTAGSVDLTEGMFRHLVVTGRSRLALYLARIPAGLAIVVPLVAVGFTIVCAVCVFAAPTQLNYNGATVPADLSLSGFESWAGRPRRTRSSADFGSTGPSSTSRRARPGGAVAADHQRGRRRPRPPPPGTAADRPGPMRRRRWPARTTRDYQASFLYPSVSLMVKSGLWLELEATIGFIVGLGLASLIGQRTVPVILMIVLEVILTPILSRATSSPT